MCPTHCTGGRSTPTKRSAACVCVAADCVWTDARVVSCVTDLWPAPGQSSAPDLIGWEVCRAGAVSEGAGLESDEEETNKQSMCVFTEGHRCFVSLCCV